MNQKVDSTDMQYTTSNILKQMSCTAMHKESSKTCETKTYMIKSSCECDHIWCQHQLFFCCPCTAGKLLHVHTAIITAVQLFNHCSSTTQSDLCSYRSVATAISPRQPIWVNGGVTKRIQPKLLQGLRKKSLFISRQVRTWKRALPGIRRNLYRFQKISPVRDWRSTSLECIDVGGGGAGEAIIWDRRLQVCHFACSSVYFSLYFINFLFDSVW